MAELIEVQCAGGAHAVTIAELDLKTAVAGSGESIIIADAFFRYALAEMDVPVFFIDALETSKDLVEMPPLIEWCRKHGLTRDGHLIAIGGGIVQDVACFVASTYMRGVKWTYFPTTLLSMVDSCIGGKSSINVGEYKNLVGTFYPPAKVVIVPDTAATLPVEHVAAGRAEAAKICFAHGDEVFDRYLAIDAIYPSENPTDLIALSLASKKWFIEIDEFDRAERLLLNFGHSFGHALESCSSYLVPHGVAVGIGCLAAVAVSCQQHPGLQANQRIQNLNAQMVEILRPVEDLSAALDDVERGQFFRYWKSDKKHTSEVYRPILVDENAQLYRAALPRDETSANQLWAGFCAARTLLVDSTRTNFPIARNGSDRRLNL